MEKISFDLLLKSALDLFYGAIDALETEEYENALINELCILVWDFKHRKIKGKKVFSKLDTIAENYKGKLQHIDTNIRLIFTAISNLYNMLENDFLEGKKYIIFTPNDIIKYSDDTWLKPKKTLIFVYEEVNDGFISEDNELNVFAFGVTEDELKIEIIDQIISAWQCYVEEDDLKLVPKAQELKYRYKEIFDKLEVAKEW